MTLRGWTILALCLTPSVLPAQAAPGGPVVHAILFYSPTCPHCHTVMTRDLPPLAQRYGDRLRLATVNVANPGGQTLYQSMVDHFRLPDDRLGVPALVVGNRVLVGSYEIPNEFPGIIEQGLASGGIDWPAVPLVRQALAQAEAARQRRADSVAAVEAARRTADSLTAAAIPRAETTVAAAPVPARTETAATREPAPSQPAAAPPQATPRTPGATPVEPPRPESARAGPTDAPGAVDVGQSEGVVARAAAEMAGSRATLSAVRERFLRDPVGNSTSVVVILLMLATLGLVVAEVRGRASVPRAPAWLIPALGAVGLGVALYLSYVEVTGILAVCGPVGDCNTVQQSEFARLFGFLPVGVLGALGYVAMSGAWLAGLRLPERPARLARLALWAMALGGTVFSVYLTFLEPFVIGATCAWCLTSAVVTTLMMVATTPTVRSDLDALRARGAPAGPTDSSVV